MQNTVLRGGYRLVKNLGRGGFNETYPKYCQVIVTRAFLLFTHPLNILRLPLSLNACLAKLFAAFVAKVLEK